MAEPTAKLAGLVARMLYAPGNLPKTALKTLEDFWDRITHASGEVRASD